MKTRSNGFSVLAGILLISAAFYLAFTWRAPEALVSLSHPTISGSSYKVSITNTGKREIHYTVSPMQIKCNGVWAEHIVLSDRIDHMRPNRPTPISPGTIWRVPDERLAPGQAAIIDGRLPMHITSPQGATAWRVAVEWSYSTPSKMQQWQSEAIRFITRRPQAFRPARHTNYTSEISF